MTYEQYRTEVLNLAQDWSERHARWQRKERIFRAVCVFTLGMTVVNMLLLKASMAILGVTLWSGSFAALLWCQSWCQRCLQMRQESLKEIGM